MHPKTLSRTLASIVYAPEPPPGYAYLYPAPGNARGVRRSPLAPFLTAPVTTDDGITLTAPLPADPARPLPDPDTLPTHYRPFPAPFLPTLHPLPPPSGAGRPAYADGRPDIPAIITANRTGDYFPLPTGNNVSYYRRNFPGYTFHTRSGTIYARYTGTPGNPAPAPSNALPPDARALRHSTPRYALHTPDTPPPNFLHIYIRPDTRSRHLPGTEPGTAGYGQPGAYTGHIPLPRDLDGTAQDRYLPLPRTAPENLAPLYPFLHRHALHICYNAADSAPDLTDATFYTPLPVLPVPHAGPAPDAP